MIRRAEQKPNIKDIEEETVRCLGPEVRILASEIRKGSRRKTPERMRSRSGRLIEYVQQKEAVSTEAIVLKCREEIKKTFSPGDDMKSLKNRICNEGRTNITQEIAIGVLAQVFEHFRGRPMTDAEEFEAYERILKSEPKDSY